MRHRQQRFRNNTPTCIYRWTRYNHLQRAYGLAHIFSEPNRGVADQVLLSPRTIAMPHARVAVSYATITLTLLRCYRH